MLSPINAQARFVPWIWQQPRPRARLGTARAFSLIELVLVATIIAIVAGIAMPRFSGALARQRADAAARRVMVDLHLAQREAKTSGKSQVVNFHVGDDLYRLVGMKHGDRRSQEYAVSLAQEPYQAEILSTDFGGKMEIEFDMYGIPVSGGSVIIRVGDHLKTITVDPDTGKASVQ